MAHAHTLSAPKKERLSQASPSQNRRVSEICSGKEGAEEGSSASTYCVSKHASVGCANAWRHRSANSLARGY